MNIRERYAMHIEYLHSIDDDCEVVRLEVAEALQKQLDELKASIPKIKADAVREGVKRFGQLDGYNAIDLADYIEDYANQLEGKD